MRGAILYQHGQQEQAEAIWSEVKQLISTASNADKAFISLKLGHTLLQPGETERGQKLFQDSEPYMRELGVSNGVRQNLCLISSVDSYNYNNTTKHYN